MRNNWTVTGALNFPLFTGGNIRGDVVIAEANLREAQAQMRIMRQAAQLDARDAAYRLMAAEATWEASVGTTQLAERAYEIALVRYKEGVSTQTELLDQRLVARAGAREPRGRGARPAGGARAAGAHQDLPVEHAERRRRDRARSSRRRNNDPPDAVGGRSPAVRRILSESRHELEVDVGQVVAGGARPRRPRRHRVPPPGEA